MKIPLINITPEILNLISEIDEFKGQWKTLGILMPEKLNQLRKVATIESIGSSTRIEGVKLSDQEVEKLLLNIGSQSFKTRDEQEVAGYAEAMEMIFDSYDHINLTQNHIKQLHSILLKYSTKDSRHKGEYKKLSNNVEAFDHEGKSLGIVFQTTSPFDTPMEMQELIEWTNQEIDKKILHPLIIISAFIVYFLAIHPFQDGNGRLSRVITTLILLRSNYKYVPYSSLEKVIEENKNNYYISLRRSQKKIQTGDANIEHWLSFFLRALQKQKNNLQIKMDNLKLIIKLPELSERVIEIIKEQGKINITELQKLTNANRNTLKLRLKELVYDNIISQQGIGRSTFYTLNGHIQNESKEFSKN